MIIYILSFDFIENELFNYYYFLNLVHILKNILDFPHFYVPTLFFVILNSKIVGLIYFIYQLSFQNSNCCNYFHYFGCCFDLFSVQFLRLKFYSVFLFVLHLLFGFIHSVLPYVALLMTHYYQENEPATQCTALSNITCYLY